MIENIVVSVMVGGIAGLIGSRGLAWRLIERRFDHKYDERLEDFRAELARLTHEHEVRFGTLHERRVDVVANVYERLERLHMVARSRARTADDADDATEAVDNRFFEFVTYYYPHAIWLDPDLCEKINKVLAPLNAMRVVGEQVAHYPQLAETIEELEEKIGQLRKPIEAEFRALLGVEESSSPADRSS